MNRSFYINTLNVRNVSKNIFNIKSNFFGINLSMVPEIPMQEKKIKGINFLHFIFFIK